jgi:hypothetical protein
VFLLYLQSAAELNDSFLHTYHSRFIPEGVAEVSQIFLRDTHVLPKLVSYEEYNTNDMEGTTLIKNMLHNFEILNKTY